MTGPVVVIKYGGHAMGTAATRTEFAEAVLALRETGVSPVVVHGGGQASGCGLGACWAVA